MALTVDIGPGAVGKVRSFWVGFGLSAVTLGLYTLWWWFYVNEEARNLGVAREDPELADTSPGLSVVALIAGWFVWIPTLVTYYRYGSRIRRAQGLVGIDESQQFNKAAFLLFFPGGLLVVPAIVWYWYVTKHQNLMLSNVAAPGAVA
jgi:hypothetical protein